MSVLLNLKNPGLEENCLKLAEKKGISSDRVFKDTDIEKIKKISRINQLIIDGAHGAKGSAVIFGGSSQEKEKRYSPFKLSKILSRGIKGLKLKKITLNPCYSGSSGFAAQLAKHLQKQGISNLEIIAPNFKGTVFPDSSPKKGEIAACKSNLFDQASTVSLSIKSALTLYEIGSFALKRLEERIKIEESESSPNEEILKTLASQIKEVKSGKHQDFSRICNGLVSLAKLIKEFNSQEQLSNSEEELLSKLKKIERVAKKNLPHLNRLDELSEDACKEVDDACKEAFEFVSTDGLIGVDDTSNVDWGKAFTTFRI